LALARFGFGGVVEEFKPARDPPDCFTQRHSASLHHRNRSELTVVRSPSTVAFPTTEKICPKKKNRVTAALAHPTMKQAGAISE
jgi:hypothetical protein